MSDTYERNTEKKYCYHIREYVEVTIVIRRWLMEDGHSWAEDDRAVECPNLLECRRVGHNCFCVNPKTGTDPFVPFRNLLADMW